MSDEPTPSYEVQTVQEVRIFKSIPEAILTWLLQVIGVSSAVVFGAYSILSWKDAEIAKQQAATANIFSLLALCSQTSQNNNETQLTQICSQVNSRAQESLAAIASGLFPPIPTSTSPPEVGLPPASHARGPDITTIVVGILIPLILIVTSLSGFFFCIRSRRQRFVLSEEYVGAGSRVPEMKHVGVDGRRRSLVLSEEYVGAGSRAPEMKHVRVGGGLGEEGQT